jgi:hypothetical protein
MEQWLPVVGFEGLYAVSDRGRIRREAPAPHTCVGKILVPCFVPGRQYLRVCLRKNLTNHNRVIHRLVLEAFVGRCPKNGECRHLNGHAGDNRLVNLCWGTKKENGQDKVRHQSIAGVNNPHARLTDDLVRYIRRCGKSYGVLAKELHVTRCTIRDAKKGRNWKHVISSR